jgi:predicted CopG family antitoxin
MRYLVKDKKLQLKYVPGKGAWTYHLEIPGTKDIQGKWGEIKVSGSIDGFKVEKRNLAPIKGGDKIISVNDVIRKAIGKKEGDLVTVTLYLEERQEDITEKKILAAFQDSDVIDNFKRLPKKRQELIIQDVLSKKTESKQIQLIVGYIESLS